VAEVAQDVGGGVGADEEPPVSLAFAAAAVALPTAEEDYD
jgi:hypothetical protein